MNEWINVNDKLPEDGRYLTCNMFSGYQILHLTSFSKDRGNIDDYDMKGLGAGFYDYDSECGYYPMNTITHWMPLPELPKF